MALLDIVTFPDPRLKERSLNVSVFDDALRTLVKDMAETMYAAPGVGLAAVQVGVLKRLLIMDPRSGDEGADLQVFINPEILEGEGEQLFEEGCLSLPDFSEEVKRMRRVTVRYRDEHGNHLTREVEGFPSVILQHELDHLDGVLATDRISRLKRSLYIRRRNKALKQQTRGTRASANV